MPHVCAPPRAANRSGLRGRKLETGFSARQDLLLFGETADGVGADPHSAEDAWIGLGAAPEAEAPAAASPQKEG